MRGKESMSLEQRKAETEKQRREGDWETEKQGKTGDAAELSFSGETEKRKKERK